ncbi:hypothetical protein E2562_024131 [Oryza meyeriana var. granulata]|uniref:Uncharacterized protein n=1 Tax=Oryza meyeriana var. granulata TaxID=110450 RepID=A0A6G1EP66_9ORYZ|nr:hypothetical protein E2562_024131 [Oryza meyeriana var. granulata]
MVPSRDYAINTFSEDGRVQPTQATLHPPQCLLRLRYHLCQGPHVRRHLGHWHWLAWTSTQTRHLRTPPPHLATPTSITGHIAATVTSPKPSVRRRKQHSSSGGS